MKQCRQCCEAKPESEYYLDQGKPRAVCKVCWRANRGKYVAANKVAVDAANAEYRASEQGRKVRAALDRCRSQREDVIEYKKQWARTEKGKAARRRRVNRYSKTPKGQAATKCKKVVRRYWHLRTERTLTAEQWSEILGIHDHRCAYCGRAFTEELPATQDHVIPVSKGGHHTKENVVPACKPCNSSKADREMPRLLLKPVESQQTCLNSLSQSLPIN